VALAEASAELHEPFAKMQSESGEIEEICDRKESCKMNVYNPSDKARRVLTAAIATAILVDAAAAIGKMVSGL